MTKTKPNIMLVIIVIALLLSIMPSESAYANNFNCWNCGYINNRAQTYNCRSCRWDICSHCGACYWECNGAAHGAETEKSPEPLSSSESTSPVLSTNTTNISSSDTNRITRTNTEDDSYSAVISALIVIVGISLVYNGIANGLKRLFSSGSSGSYSSTSTGNYQKNMDSKKRQEDKNKEPIDSQDLVMIIDKKKLDEQSVIWKEPDEQRKKELEKQERARLENKRKRELAANERIIRQNKIRENFSNIRKGTKLHHIKLGLLNVEKVEGNKIIAVDQKGVSRKFINELQFVDFLDDIEL